MVPVVLMAIAAGARAQDGGPPATYPIDGVVLWKGKPPKPEVTEVALDVDVCGRKKTRPGLSVSRRGGIQDVVLELDAIEPAATGAPAGTDATIDEQRCELVPHLLVVPVGTRVAFTNGDAVTHDVHVYSLDSPFDQPLRTGAKVDRVFDKPGPLLVRCDYHVWTSAWVLAVPRTTAYAVTSSDGRFHFPAVPAGKRVLHLWHETLGRFDQPIEVPAKEPVRIELQRN